MFLCLWFEQCLSLSEEELKERQVLHLDIAYDDIPEKYFKEEEVTIQQLAVQSYWDLWIGFKNFQWLCFLSKVSKLLILE